VTNQIPKILIEFLASGTWKQVSPNVIRQCLGDDLDDLKLFGNLDDMLQMSERLDNAGYVDDPEFCMTRECKLTGDDPRLEFPRALFIGGSIMPGDDVFVALHQMNCEDYDPHVLVLDWRKSVPSRWTERGKLSELVCRICTDCPLQEKEADL